MMRLYGLHCIGRASRPIVAIWAQVSHVDEDMGWSRDGPFWREQRLVSRKSQSYAILHLLLLRGAGTFRRVRLFSIYGMTSSSEIASRQAPAAQRCPFQLSFASGI